MTFHSLVASAFYGKKVNMVVDHINNNKRDNRLCNLQYITQRENSSKDKNRILPTGVYKHENAYRVMCSSNGGRAATIGTFEKESDAENAYKYAVDNGIDEARKKFLYKKTCGKKGVSFCKFGNDFRATATVNKKQINLGRYKTEIEAIEARRKWEIENGL